MNRRRLLVLAGALPVTLPVAAHAQPAPRRIGYLIAGDAEPAWTLFRKAMANLGYVEGRTVSYEFRAGGTDEARLAAYAAELVQLKVDVLVAALLPAVDAARKATSTIPIVFFAGSSELAGIDNIARPGGNATGVVSTSATLGGKTLQLLHELIPGLTRVGVLLNARDPFRVPLLAGLEPVARAEGIELVTSYIAAPGEIEPAIARFADQKVGGLFAQPTLGLQEIAHLALKYRLPAISFRREFPDAGGLLSCGADVADNYRIVAEYIDRILKGAAPASLPVQQAARTEIVVNQKTARALGLVIPPLFLGRADEVIE